jgi:hypothetical protein
MRIQTLPQGPRGHALLGSLPDFQRDQLGFYARCAREFGDVVPTRFPFRRVVLIYHPDAIEEVLVTKQVVTGRAGFRATPTSRSVAGRASASATGSR